MIFTMPFYLERVKELSPKVIGMVLISSTVMLLFLSPVFGWVSDKIGYRLLRCTGFTIMAGGLYWMSYITKETTVTNIVMMLLVYGLGISMFTPPNNSLLMGSVPKHKLGVAAGMLATTRNLGMMMGVASASAIFTYRVKYYVAANAMNKDAVIKMYDPYSDVFLASAVVCILGIFVAFIEGKRNSTSA